MARSLSSAKLLSAALVDGVFVSINRRGYASTAAAATSSKVVASNVVRGSGARSGIVKAREERAKSSETNSWAPDPVTGYYRPENCSAEIDVAEHREMLLNHHKH